MVGVEVGAGMVDKEGNITVSDRNAMIVDASGTVLGSIFGTTTVTSFVESTSGVAAGARTGLAALFTGLLFSLSVFAYPVLGIFSGSVPNIALIYVGICMFMNLKELDWHDWVAIASGFMTIIMMKIVIVKMKDLDQFNMKMKMVILELKMYQYLQLLKNVLLILVKNQNRISLLMM